MELPQTGGCQCGTLRYEIARAPNAVYTRHCTECRRLTGSAFPLGLVLAAEVFRLTEAEPRPFRRAARRARHRAAGTLDDTSWLRPTLHFWTRSAQPWVVLPSGGRSFETQPVDFGRMRPPSGR